MSSDCEKNKRMKISREIAQKNLYQTLFFMRFFRVFRINFCAARQFSDFHESNIGRLR
jgi:hypothetical protein